jgi:hypothetical protein
MFRFLPLQSSTPAMKITVVLALAGLFLAAEIAVWFAFVPHLISPQTFAWISILALTTTIAATATMVAARATRSIAHVLYEVEHPAVLPKL